MKTLHRAFAGLAAGFLVLLLSSTQAQAVHPCACQDVNNNGICDPGEPEVAADEWIGKKYISPHPFLVPSGCDHILPKAPGLTHIVATKIVFEGELAIAVVNSAPVVLEANPNVIPGAGLGDGSITVTGRIETGGQTDTRLFPDHTPENEAIHKRTITIVARGRTTGPSDQHGDGVCNFLGARLSTVTPTGSNDIGIHCDGDITIRGSKFVAARINMHAHIGAHSGLPGKIDARATGLGAVASLGEACDDPVMNLSNGALAPGNGNGILDAADFPCALNLGDLYPGTTTFVTLDQLRAFCEIAAGPNQFLAFNDPLLMFATGVLDLRGLPGPGAVGDTILIGRYEVKLASLTGDILLQNTNVSHGPPFPGPGGAHIKLASRPALYDLLYNDHEDFFGPFGTLSTPAVINIDSACLRSKNPIEYGDTGTTNVLGTPDAPPCAQYPADFVARDKFLN